MIAYKHIGRVVAVLVILAVAAIGAVGVFASTADMGVSFTYEEALFNTEQILSVDILIDPEDWQELLDTAINETYYRCDIRINGQTYSSVGIRAKGNTSLSMVAASDSDRYSFKVQFDEYVTGQTCMGLDKLVLNNNYADATMMKEALTYDLFALLGADASLYNYAQVSVNGQYWGVYLALEAVEESFAMRNYGAHYGQLYKPESMGMGGAGKMAGVDEDALQQMLGLPEEGTTPDEAKGLTPPGDGQSPQEPGDGAGGGFPGDADGGFPGNAGAGFGDTGGGFPSGGGFGGAPGQGGDSASSLNYIDDALSSYEAIWQASVFGSSDVDHRRVVAALAEIAEGENLEAVMDVDNLLRYMAVHTFVVNLDSLTGNMAHNYYLYEQDGRLNLIPWDYNLAFGGFMSGDASVTVNLPIDTPFSGVDAEDRQFFTALLEVDDYREQYHAYLGELVQAVQDGRVSSVIARIRQQIDDLVAQDPTAFYTQAEYEQAVAMLEQTLSLRAESVAGQLAGEIPATTQGQQDQPELLVDASAIDLSVMGTMGGMDGQRGDQMPGNASADEPNGQRGQPPGEMGGFPGQDDGQTSPRSADRAGQGGGPNQDLDPTENSAGWAGAAGVLAVCLAGMLFARLLAARFKRRG